MSERDFEAMRERAQSFVDTFASAMTTTGQLAAADQIARDALALDDERRRLAARVEALEKEKDGYRIEADCAMRDYDGLEVDVGVMREALEKIAEGRANKAFDPWARDVARAALQAREDSR